MEITSIRYGTERDRKKIRRLTLAGWRVLEYSTELLTNDPIGIIAEIREALAQ
jgi:very-short-patch-repair endonuclease